MTWDEFLETIFFLLTALPLVAPWAWVTTRPLFISFVSPVPFSSTAPIGKLMYRAR